MQSRISYCIIALALVLGGCRENINTTDPVEAEDELEFVKIDRLNSSECEYTVHYSDVTAYVAIDGVWVGVMRFDLTDDDGNTIHAYCANLNDPCYDEARYKCASADDYFKNGEETKIMAALTYIMNHYGEMETTNPKGFFQMVQCVIWKIIHDCEINVIDNELGEIIKEAINHIYDNIDDITTDYQGVSIKSADTATEDGLFVNYGPYQISENALLTDVDFQLTFDQNDVDAIFVNDLGEKITLVKPEAPFYLRAPSDVFGDVEFTATATTTEELWYVNDFLFFVDVREGDYQQLFHPIMSLDTWDSFHTCSGNLTIMSTEPEPESETITLTELSWNNGNGSGINRFTVDGITLKNNKNCVTPVNFDVLITKTPAKNDETAIYTTTERTVTKNNGLYVKEYEIKVALYNGGVWKGYGGIITVDNPGGNDANQQIKLERIF